MNKWGVGLTLLLASASVLAKDIQLLNVSYDPTRELYEQYNKAFSAHWKQETGDNVVITEVACLPEPPCDWRITTLSPVSCFQCALNALLYCSYSSRVGS